MCEQITNAVEKAYNNLGGGSPDFALGSLLKCLSGSALLLAAQATALPAIMTTGTVPVSKLLMTTPALEAGEYLLTGTYDWNKNSAGNDFVGSLKFDGNTINPSTGFDYMRHAQEPKDQAGASYPPGSGSGTSQAYTHTFLINFTLAGVHTFEVLFNSSNVGNAATMWNNRLFLIRIS